MQQLAIELHLIILFLLIDNGSYGSTGDQKTFTNENTSLKDVAIGAGCKNVIECSGEETNENLQKASG